MTPENNTFFKKLSTQINHDLISLILSKALTSADPYRLVIEAILLSNADVCIGENQYSLPKKILLIAIGKASVAMTQAAVDKLGGYIFGGVCVCKTLPDLRPDWEKIKLVQGSHPLPDERSVYAGEQIRNYLAGSSPEDLVLVLISGGASALVTSPVEGISLGELKETYYLLLRSGATINEINAVRKHLESLKGGGLVQAAFPAKLEALLLSDVIGDDCSVIASGPTAVDPTTFQQAMGILTHYHLSQQIPKSVLAYLESGALGEVRESVKPGDAILTNVHNTIIGSNALSIKAGMDEAERLGLETICISSQMVGEARQAAQWFLGQSWKAADQQSGPCMCVAGGETTVTVRGDGLGGRNLEMALSVVKPMASDKKGTFIALATDGEDGPTDAAGAIVTADTMSRAQSLGLDPETYLQNNDAFHFFEQVGGLIKIGSTGTNVNDLTFYFRFNHTVGSSEP